MAHAATAQADKSSSPTGIGFDLDLILLIVTAMILTVGIVMVTSAGYILAAAKFEDGFYYTKKQAIAMAIGLAVMYLFSRIKPRFWQVVAPHLLLIGSILMLLVFVPGIGVEMGGSHRWIRLPFGFHLQSSELMKYALIIFLARSLALKADGVREFAVGFLPNFMVTALVVFLVLAQPDFGSGVIVSAISFLMLFVAGVRLRHLIGGALLALPFLFYVAISAPYRLKRIMTFFDPWADPKDAGFQVLESLKAFGCGGAWGVGIGKSIQKLWFLPQPHTDFIYSVIGEELGLLGVAGVLLLYYVLICRGLVISIRAADPFQKYLAFGITSLIGLQAMVNMGVAMGMLPTKGLPLPLISLGGTSIVMNLAGIGILMAIARRSNRFAEEAQA